jgi:hypothetical protein
VQTGQQYPGDAGHLACLGRKPRQKGDQLQLANPVAQVVLATGAGVPAAVARQPGHCVLAFELSDDVAAGRMLAGQKDPDFHDFPHAHAPTPASPIDGADAQAASVTASGGDASICSIIR